MNPSPPNNQVVVQGSGSPVPGQPMPPPPAGFGPAVAPAIPLVPQQFLTGSALAALNRRPAPAGVKLFALALFGAFVYGAMYVRDGAPAIAVLATLAVVLLATLTAAFKIEAARLTSMLLAAIATIICLAVLIAQVSDQNSQRTAATATSQVLSEQMHKPGLTEVQREKLGNQMVDVDQRRAADSLAASKINEFTVLCAILFGGEAVYLGLKRVRSVYDPLQP